MFDFAGDIALSLLLLAVNGQFGRLCALIHVNIIITCVHVIIFVCVIITCVHVIVLLLVMYGVAVVGYSVKMYSMCN